MFDALAALLIFDLAGSVFANIAPASPLGAALHFFVMDVAKILLLLTTVIYLMGWLRALFTPERVRALMKGRSGPGARLLAVGLGAVTPFCSCSSIPLFIGFVEAGIPLGVTLSFLIASPMVDLAAMVVLSSVIGWQITAIYVLTGISVAFIGGYVLQAFKLERWVEDYVWQIRMGEAQVDTADTSLRARHDYAWNEVRQIVGRIWKYVLIGVGVGALIHGYVPEDFVARIAGDGSVWSVIVAVLVGVPMYSDAVGIIPVAEALLLKGVPIGTVLAFMMAVVALSLPEMLILRKVVKWPLLGIFAGYLAIAFVLVGVAFNALRTVI
ncbi:MAG: permease [Pseudomonadota bacterium]|nr:permease [Pseudomonadota bacterium]